MSLVKVYKFCILGICMCVIVACATTRVVKPLAKGETEVGISAGGPLVGFEGTVIPVPMSSIYMARGITDSLSLFAGLNGTSLAFGVVQLDLGVTYELFAQKAFRPGISVSPVTNFMIDTWEGNFRFYPQVDANAYWNYRKEKGLLYLGMSNWFELQRKALYDLDQENHWIPNIHIGTRFQRPKLEWIIEARYLALNYPNGLSVVDYKGIGSKGAFGLYLGINKKF